jgi:hypothetical protein
VALKKRIVMKLITVKVKFNLEPATKAQRDSSTLSLTWALDGVGGQRHAPAVLLPGRTRYSLYTRRGGPRSRSGQVQKISPPPGFDPRTVQPVAWNETHIS